MTLFFMLLSIIILIQYIPLVNSKIDPTQFPETILHKYNFLRSVSNKRSITNNLNTETARVRTNANCQPTDYSLDFWKANGGTARHFFGDWYGFGRLLFSNKTNGDILLSSGVVQIWNISYNNAGGYIFWNDTFRPDIKPDNPSDYFKRYLQQNELNGYYACTDTSNSVTNISVGYELDAFGQTTLVDTLLNLDNGGCDSICSYHFVPTATPKYSEVQVNCIYYDTLATTPPGTVLQYYLSMKKQ